MTSEIYTPAVPRQAAASNGRAAVLVQEWPRGGLCVARYAPADLGRWERRAEFDDLCKRAARKLGYVPASARLGGWQKIDVGSVK
ncbi:MAG: hypothetical protein QM656_03335 [Paracoccaceae bacterium]